jgi:hypothetical protein
MISSISRSDYVAVLLTNNDVITEILCSYSFDYLHSWMNKLEIDLVT